MSVCERGERRLGREDALRVVDRVHAAPYAMARAYGAVDGDELVLDDGTTHARGRRGGSRAVVLGSVVTLALACAVIAHGRAVDGWRRAPTRPLGSAPAPALSAELGLPFGGGAGAAIAKALQNVRNQIMAKFEVYLKSSTYNTATCTSQLRFHGWCESNAVIFASGCLASYPGTYYYSVGAPYPVHNSFVNEGLRTCVKTYYKNKVVSDYATLGMSLDEATSNDMVTSMFPESIEDLSSWVDAFEDADLNAESDFGADENFGSEAGATASLNTNAVSKYFLPSSTSCSDTYCFSFCPSDLGLKSSYSIKVPKVCASFRIAGRTYKKCISVPTVKFKLPITCKQVCVNVPDLCTLITKAQSYTAVTQVSSVQGLLALNVLPSTVTSSIQDALSAAEKYTQVASKTSVDQLVSSNLLNGGVIQIIKDAQTTLSNIANGLEDKLRHVVSLVWGDMAASADALLALIEDGFLDALDSTSAAASLGSQRDKASLYGDIKEALRKAFRGEELALRSKIADTEEARLGASGRGSCFDMILSGYDDYEAPGYLMPWPEKLKNDPLAPGSIVVKFPTLTTSLCAKISKFNVPPQVAVKLFDAFNTMFESLFTELYTQTGLKTLVEQIKNLGNGKFYGGRRLLSAEDEQLFVELHLKYKQQLAEAEVDVFNHIVKFHEHLTSLSLGDFATNRQTSSLGAGSFDAILERFTNDLKEALKLFAQDTAVEGTFTLAFKSETSMAVKTGLTQTGEFLSDVLGMENTFEQTKIFPTGVPGLLIAVDVKVSLSLPYFLRAEMEGELGVSVDVAFPVDIAISKSPSVKFGTPKVTSKVVGSAAIKAGMQTGIVTQIESAYVALCAGAVCAGPELYARQDVYYGMDAFAMTLDRAVATCESEAHSLTALWNDWDYPSHTKSQCTASVAGVGGYLQVPKTELEVRMMMKPIPVNKDAGGGAGGDAGGEDPGMDALLPSPALQLFDFTPLIKSAYDMTGNFHAQELFSECTAPNNAVPRGCAPTCPVSVKFKHTKGGEKYEGRCLTSSGGVANLPVMADCTTDAKDASGQQSQWWELIHAVEENSVRIRLAESFSCLTATPKSNAAGGVVLALANCDVNNAAQLLRYDEQCVKLNDAHYPCLRTAAGNPHNVGGSASKPRYASGYFSSSSTKMSEAYITLWTSNSNAAEFIFAKA